MQLQCIFGKTICFADSHCLYHFAPAGTFLARFDRESSLRLAHERNEAVSKRGIGTTLRIDLEEKRKRERGRLLPHSKPRCCAFCGAGIGGQESDGNRSGRRDGEETDKADTSMPWAES